MWGRATGEMCHQSKSSTWHLLPFVLLGHKFNYTERTCSFQPLNNLQINVECSRLGRGKLHTVFHMEFFSIITPIT